MNYFGFMLLLLLAIFELSQSKDPAYCAAQRLICQNENSLYGTKKNCNYIYNACLEA